MPKYSRNLKNCPPPPFWHLNTLRWKIGTPWDAKLNNWHPFGTFTGTFIGTLTRNIEIKMRSWQVFGTLEHISLLFTFEPTNFKNLSGKHDETSINLTKLFDHGVTALLSIFLVLMYLFTPLYASVYTLKIYKWSKIRTWFAFWLNIDEIQQSKYIVKTRNPIFLDSALFFEFPSSRGV